MAGPGYNEDLLIGQPTPFGITASGTRCHVLRNPAQVGECSTPFGITASGTGRRAPSAERAEAFTAEMCSTPFGITASGTSKKKTVLISNMECSTPFGITASGTRWQAG